MQGFSWEEDIDEGVRSIVLRNKLSKKTCVWFGKDSERLAAAC